jgi:hypothetical protein
MGIPLSRPNYCRAATMRNLKLGRERTDPRRAATGRGHSQMEVAMQFAVNNWQPITARAVAEHVFWRVYWDGKHLNASHYQRLRRAFSRIAYRVRRLPGRGRPWLWALKPEIEADPEEWWRKHKHPFRYLNTTTVIKENQTDGSKRRVLHTQIRKTGLCYTKSH